MQNLTWLWKEIWQNDLASLYQQGRIPNAATFLAAMFSSLTTHSDYETWIEPALRLQEERQTEPSVFFLKNYNRISLARPSLVLARDSKIVSVAEVLFMPGQHADFRPAMSRLEILAQLADTGNFSAAPGISTGAAYPEGKGIYHFFEPLVCVLAVVGKKGGYAMDYPYLKREYSDRSFWPSFVHLTAVTEGNSAVFTGRSGPIS